MPAVFVFPVPSMFIFGKPGVCLTFRILSSSSIKAATAVSETKPRDQLDTIVSIGTFVFSALRISLSFTECEANLLPALKKGMYMYMYFE